MPTTYILIGGGCFGSHHLRQLEKGRAKGRIGPDDRIVVVDRNPACRVIRELAEAPNPHVRVLRSDWLTYYCAAIDGLPAEDEIVPAPFAPHLAAEWLLWSLQQHLGPAAVARVPFADAFGGLPYEALGPSGDRFISAAGWVCPPNCRAPRKCPAILAPRTWDLNDTIRAFAAAHADRYLPPVIFNTLYRTTGIETILADTFRRLRDDVLALAQQGEIAGKQLIIATASPCHGATTLVEFAPVAAAVASAPESAA